MAYKIVGANEESEFPPRVMARLAELFAAKESAPVDTGWRIYSSPIENGWTCTNLRIRRIGNVVYIQGRLNGTAASEDEALAIPAGFRFVQGNHTVPVVSATIILDRTTFTLGTVSRLAQINILMQWVTDDPWPTTLPGTAV